MPPLIPPTSLMVRWLAAAAAVGGVVAGLAGCGRPPAEAAPLDLVGSWGEVGSRPGQFSYPRAMDRSDTSLWIVDKQARVQRIDPATGHALGEWQMPAWEMGKPTGITVWNPTPTEGDELIFVPDTHYFRVMVYKASDAKPGVHSVRASTGTAEVGTESVGAESPTPLAQFGEYGEGDGQFIYLTDVVVLPKADGTGIGRLLVSEYGGHDRISVFDVGGDVAKGTGTFTFVRSIGKFGSGDGVEFSRPQSMAVDTKRGWLVVTDACNHRIGVLTLEGELVRWIGTPAGGRGVGEFLYPYGLTLLPDGTAMVCEFGNNRVQRIDLNTGASLGIYGVPGRGTGQLSTPWAVTELGGRVYILDSGNNRVQTIKAPGSGLFGLGAG